MIITDLTTQIQFRKIVHLELDEYIDYIVTSEETGYDKPHPAPYKLALKKLNFNKNEIIWMFGDDPIKDIKEAEILLMQSHFRKFIVE